MVGGKFFSCSWHFILSFSQTSRSTDTEELSLLPLAQSSLSSEVLACGGQGRPEEVVGAGGLVGKRPFLACCLPFVSLPLFLLLLLGKEMKS